MMPARRPPAREPRITSAEIAEKVLRNIASAMDALQSVISRETALVKLGKLNAAAELAPEKEEKAALYTRLMLLAREEVKTLAAYDAAAVEDLKRRHETFRSEIQTNLAVLATAREVAEDLLRTVASEVGVATSAGTYGRRGATASVGTTSARGIAINTAL
jgi:hypothetical protein